MNMAAINIITKISSITVLTTIQHFIKCMFLKLVEKWIFDVVTKSSTVVSNKKHGEINRDLMGDFSSKQEVSQATALLYRLPRVRKHLVLTKWKDLSLSSSYSGWQGLTTAIIIFFVGSF